jgi:hypothetical protein
MQTGSSETLIGWKSGKTTYMSLYGTDWRERGYGLWHLQQVRVADPDPDSIGSVDPDAGGQK